MRNNLIWIFCLSVILFLFSRPYINYQLDDALIYLRYIRNFREGNGLVYNIGEKFNGLTSPLYTYILIIISYLTDPQNLVILNNYASAVFFLSAIVVTSFAFFSSNFERFIFSMMMVSIPFFYRLFGMESLFFLFVMSLVFWFYQKNDERFFIFLCLLFITRSEAVLLALPFAIFYLYRKKKLPSPKTFFFSSLVLALPLLFNQFYYGSIFSDSAHAKIEHGKSGMWGSYQMIKIFSWEWREIFGFNYRYYIPFIIITLYGFYLKFKEDITKILVSYILIFFLFYTYINIVYFWYKAPIVFIVYIYFFFGLNGLAKKIFPISKIAFIVLSVVFINIFITNFSLFKFELASDGPLYRIKRAFFEEKREAQDYEKIGNWIKNNTNPLDDVAMVEIGVVGYYSERKIVDILGLVNKENAFFIGKNDLYSWLTIYQPKYILVHQPIYSWETSIDLLTSKKLYVEDKRFKFKRCRLYVKDNNASPHEIRDAVVSRVIK